MTAQLRKRTRKPQGPRLPPPWVRRCDWTRSGQSLAFTFPHLHGDEVREAAELGRLWDYAETHPFRFNAWVARVDAARTPPCDCPQCWLERHHV